MSKQQVIEQIRSFNRTAEEGFLTHFDQPALENYLKRLELARVGRGRQSVWVRSGAAPAACTREH